jgi:ABC-type multidrug transport system ATPase subunit
MMDAPCDDQDVDFLSRDLLIFSGRFAPRTLAPWRRLIRGEGLYVTRTVLDCPRPVIFPMGCITAIMGPSGAGKTTLMRMVSGRAHGSGVRIEGVWVASPGGWNRQTLPDMRRNTSFVEQHDDALDPASTPRQLVRFYADALHRATKPSARDRALIVDRALADVLLDGRAADTPSARLSGGQRKRTCIAIQLAREQDILFMDEPTSGLDSFSCESVFDSIAHANRERGLTVVMVIHQPAQSVFDRLHFLVVVAAGTVVYQGRPDLALAFFARHTLHGIEPSCASIDGGDDGNEDRTNGARPPTSDPDRIVVCVSKGRDESESDYDRRMRALAVDMVTAKPPETVVDRPVDRPDRRGKFLLRAWGALMCLWALCVQRTRQTASTITIIQSCVKHLGLPVLMIVALRDALVGPATGTDDVVAAHALVAMAVMWTALDAAWETFAFLPSTDRQFVKHHEDGLYGALSHLISVHAADSVVRGPLLVCFCALLYFGAGMRANAGRFFVFLAAVLVMALVARSICFACTCWLRPPHAVLALSLVLASSIIISGVYMPFYVMPEYARGIAYASFVTYGLSIAIRNQFEGETYSNDGADLGHCTYTDGDAVVDDYASAGTPVWLCFMILLVAAVVLTGATWSLLALRARAWRRM